MNKKIKKLMKKGSRIAFKDGEHQNAIKVRGREYTDCWIERRSGKSRFIID